LEVIPKAREKSRRQPAIPKDSLWIPRTLGKSIPHKPKQRANTVDRQTAGIAIFLQ
jgi:hypothetical protein